MRPVAVVPLLGAVSLISAAISVFTPAIASAAAAPNISLDTARDAGWQEAVIHTRNAAALLRFCESIAGWRVVHSGKASATAMRFYGLSPEGKAREWLVGDASARPGLLRIVEFALPQSLPIRASSQPWDTGGILSLMTRSNASADIHRAALAQGWLAYNDPVDFSFGEIRLRNVILRGPEGINVSVYERLTPRLPDDADLRQLRRPFNSMQSVRDIEVARRFYSAVLAFETVNSGNFKNPVRAPNNFGMPSEVVVSQAIPFAVFGPKKSGPTQIEVVQLVGMSGNDLAARALPGAAGIVSLRFPVADLEAIRTRLAQHDWPIAYGPAELDLPPYGHVRALAVKSPDGAVLEFFQLAPAAHQSKAAP